MQKTIIITLAVIGTLTAGFFLLKGHKAQPDAPVSELQAIYNRWKVNFNINVGAAEDSYRFGVFSKNYEIISAHNKLRGRSFNMGLNAFTHLTQEEFSATHLGLKPKVGAHATRKNISKLSVTDLPQTVDWTPKMNPAKDQGQCGSCWAFSTVGALEGLHSVKFGNLYDLSEQELVDCSSSFGNIGCNGGLMDNAFKYVISVGGLASEKDYPYTATDGECKSGLARQGKISGFIDVEARNATALQAAIAQQPVSVAIEADGMAFQGYTGGIINADACGILINHGVVAVGYNLSDRVPYYIVRNSWGASWGEKGYVRLAIVDGDGTCGIQKMVSYPTA